MYTFKLKSSKKRRSCNVFLTVLIFVNSVFILILFSNLQDTFGNTVLHMVVVTDRMGMFGYALRHPLKSGNPEVANNAGLTCLTLSCFLGRDLLFKEMLELSCKEFWRYSNICCSAYPLGALDSIRPSGETSKLLQDYIDV